METIETGLSSTSFLWNVLELKSQMQEPLPTDVIVFRCGTCKTNIPFNSCGSIMLEKPLQEDFNNIFDDMLERMKEKHAKQYECCQDDIVIHPILGPPANICLSLPASDPFCLSTLVLGGTQYKVKIGIVDSESRVIFALYQNENHDNAMYSEFIKCNFNSILNTELNETENFSEEDLIYDDESVNTFQQMLPRMIGGGRTLQAEYNYICLWCPKMDIKKGKRGYFKELKNYRDHFKKYHHGENEEDKIPMSEFIKKLNRCEPTWFCKNCRQHYSLGNQIRHKAICQQESTDSDSDVEEQMKGRKRTKSKTRIEKKGSADEVNEKNLYEERGEKRNNEDNAGPSGMNMIKQKGQNISETNKSDTDSEVESDNEISSHGNPKSKSQKKILRAHFDDANKRKDDHLAINSSGKEISVINPHNAQDNHSVESTDEGTNASDPHGESTNVESSKQHKPCRSTPVDYVHDEIYLSSEEEESPEGNIETKIELTEEENFEFQS